MATTCPEVALTPCEQAELDLAALRAAMHAYTTGGALVRWKQADKEMQYSAPNPQAMGQEIRRLQNIVNRCRGCSQPFPRFAPTDC
jgi:hypothetical protein